MATHSTILAWKILWTEESARLQSMGSQMSDKTQRLNAKMNQLMNNISFSSINVILKAICLHVQIVYTIVPQYPQQIGSRTMLQTSKSMDAQVLYIKQCSICIQPVYILLWNLNCLQIMNSIEMNLSKCQEIVKDKGSLVCCSP